VPALDDVPAALAGLVQPGDLVLTLGAGDITMAGPLLVSLLEAARG
jgi:UDP-N-acetylmuramate--alanine ligase